MAQQPAVTWGDLRFIDPEMDPPSEGYAIHALAGSSFGNPEPVIEVIRRMANGESVFSLTGFGEREIVLRLQLSAPWDIAGPALAEAEAALFRQCLAEVQPSVDWRPPATDAAVSVFEVRAARLERDTSEGWDFDERMREHRFYTLTLTCRPFARAAEPVVIPALPVPPDPGGPAVWVDVDTCDSTTGWSYYMWPVDGWSESFGVVSGAVRTTATRVSGTAAVDRYQGCYVQRTGAIAMSGLPYLVVDARVSHPGVYGSLGYAIDGSGVDPVATQMLAGGVVRAWIATPGVTDRLMVVATNVPSGPWSDAPRWVEVSNVARTDTVGDATASTTRQQPRPVEVAGSAPTEAALRLYDPAPAALGESLIYTSSNTEWWPPLRRWLVESGPVTADPTRISGGYNTLATPMTFRFAASMLTEGLYALMASVSPVVAVEPAEMEWEASITAADGSSTLGTAATQVTGSTSFDAHSTNWRTVVLGAVHLPPARVEGDQAVELVLSGPVDMKVDEVWLFSQTDGTLTRVTATTPTWLEIRSPSLGADRPSVYAGVGTVGESGVCVDWACESFGEHEFRPGTMLVFTVTAASLVAQSEIEFYPRAHSHIAGSSIA